MSLSRYEDLIRLLERAFNSEGDFVFNIRVHCFIQGYTIVCSVYFYHQCQSHFSIPFPIHFITHSGSSVCHLCWKSLSKHKRTFCLQPKRSLCDLGRAGKGNCTHEVCEEKYSNWYYTTRTYSTTTPCTLRVSICSAAAYVQTKALHVTDPKAKRGPRHVTELAAPPPWHQAHTGWSLGCKSRLSWVEGSY